MFAWELKGRFANYSPRQLPLSQEFASHLTAPDSGSPLVATARNCLSRVLFRSSFTFGWKTGTALLILLRLFCFPVSVQRPFPQAPVWPPRASAPQSLFFPPAASAPSSRLALFEWSLLPVFPTLTQLMQADFFFLVLCELKSGWCNALVVRERN